MARQSAAYNSRLIQRSDLTEENRKLDRIRETGQPHKIWLTRYNAADLVQGAPRPLECAKRGQPHEMWMDDLVQSLSKYLENSCLDSSAVVGVSKPPVLQECPPTGLTTSRVITPAGTCEDHETVAKASEQACVG